MSRVRLSRIFWIGAAVILVVAALVALVSVLRDDFSDTDGRILGTLAATLLAGSVLLAGLAVVERGVRALGWAAVAVTVPAYAAIVYAIWDFVFDGGDDTWRYGWTGVLVLVAALVAVTARLLARARRIVWLAGAAGLVAALAAAVSIWAVWRENPGDTIGKTIAVLWILAALAYFLVPVLQRFTAAGVEASAVRVLAELDGVQLVASASSEGIDPRLAPGERLQLRRRV